MPRSEVFKLVSMDSQSRRVDPTYRKIRAFLNLCELIAVGVKQKTFSERVSYAYWGDVLPQTLQHMEPLLREIRATPGEGTQHTYQDLDWICDGWTNMGVVRRWWLLR